MLDLEKQPRKGQHNLNETLLESYRKGEWLSVFDLNKLGHSHATALRWLPRYKDEKIVLAKKCNTGNRKCTKYRLTKYGCRYIKRKMADYEFGRQEQKKRK